MELDLGPSDGKHVLCALSGGADSMALLCLLAEARDRGRIKLSAAHFDHGIRAESSSDAEFCRKMCLSFSIPFYSDREEVLIRARELGMGVESAARKLRYEFLRKVKRRIGADYIALAHHMDDQAETVLMHLLRGSGPAGASGMRQCFGDIVRPLLGYTRRELRQYLTEKGIDWREDYTNAIADTPRNALRLRVIPEMEAIYPGAVPALARHAEAALVESDYMERQADIWLNEALTIKCGIKCLKMQGIPHQAVLRRALRKLLGPDLTSAKLIELIQLAYSSRGRLEIFGDWKGEKILDTLYLFRNAAEKNVEAKFNSYGITKLGNLCVIESISAKPEPCKDNPWVQVLDANALSGAVLRLRRDGDYIKPFGMKGSKSLSDYMIDRKLDRPLRDITPLLAVGDEIMWVVGYGISQTAALKSDTDNALKLECRFIDT